MMRSKIGRWRRMYNDVVASVAAINWHLAGKRNRTNILAVLNEPRRAVLIMLRPFTISAEVGRLLEASASARESLIGRNVL